MQKAKVEISDALGLLKVTIDMDITREYAAHMLQQAISCAGMNPDIKLKEGDNVKDH